MATRVLHLNPQFPLVWQDPHTLQIGVDPPVVVLQAIDDDILPLIHHLTTGISEPGLVMFATRHGVAPERTTALLETLSPALGYQSLPIMRPFVLDGPPELTQIAAQVLRDLGHPVTRADLSSDEDPPGEVIVLAHFVPHPRSFHRWLRRDRPHTSVVFSDQRITIGPRIVPGVTPCLHCELSRGPATSRVRAALASQLCGMLAPSAQPHAIRQATWHSWRLAHLGVPGLRVVMPLSDNHLEELATPSGAQCGCLGLDNEA